MPPLAERLRPLTLDDYVGQEHLVGPEGILRKNIASGTIHSMIFYGPPGVGKTTLAGIIAQSQKRPFYTLSAVDSGVKQVREVLEKASSDRFFDRPRPILFIDEIHRFNKSQQDALLKAVEKGTVVLIGATTENPSFEVNSALLSRCAVYVLQSLTTTHLDRLIDHALAEDNIIKKAALQIKEREAMYRYSGGDARKLYNILEILASEFPDGNGPEITDDYVKEKLQVNIARYDKSGDQHYDVISAFIKSVRGSDPDAALYWLARMLNAGEDLKFIARRLIILAAEDIGLANPNAMLIANACAEAVERIGMPEGRIPLSQATIYLATSPKSNSAYNAIGEAIAKARDTAHLPVPLHLRNAPTRLMKDLGYGKDYLYAHNYPEHFVQQQYQPDELNGTSYYRPADNPQEHKLKELHKRRWDDGD